MINGVLVERTVKDVVPALKVNSEGLRKVLEDLVKQYNSKQTDMEKWKVRWINFALEGWQANCYPPTEEEQYPGGPAIRDAGSQDELQDLRVRLALGRSGGVWSYVVKGKESTMSISGNLLNIPDLASKNGKEAHSSNLFETSKGLLTHS